MSSVCPAIWSARQAFVAGMPAQGSGLTRTFMAYFALTPLGDWVSFNRIFVWTAARKVPKKSTPDFEAALVELEKLVDKMESGEQSLEDALASFQRGIELTRTCQQALKQAEQRVEKLVQKDGHLLTENLEIKE